MYLGIYVKKELEQRLKALAKEQKKAPSELVREWMEDRLKENMED